MFVTTKNRTMYLKVQRLERSLDWQEKKNRQDETSCTINNHWLKKQNWIPTTSISWFFASSLAFGVHFIRKCEVVGIGDFSLRFIILTFYFILGSRECVFRSVRIVGAYYYVPIVHVHKLKISQLEWSCLDGSEFWEHAVSWVRNHKYTGWIIHAKCLRLSHVRHSGIF